MKALSLRQPWAWAILSAGKRVENRSWTTSYRGPILLHASVTCTPGQHELAVEFMVRHGFARASATDPGELPVVPSIAELARGGIIGRASIVDVLEPLERTKTFRDALIDRDATFGRRPWHFPSQYGFVLEDVEPLPFRPLKGATHLFDPELPFLQIAPPATVQP